MPTSTTLATTVFAAATGLVVLAGCSSSSSSAAHSSGASAASSSAPSSQAPSSSAAASSSAAVTTAPVPASSVPAGAGDVIKPLATKLGCVNPSVTVPKAAAAAALGATSGINCTAGTNQYVLVQLKPGASASTAAKGILTASGSTSATVYYVAGSRWMALGGPASSQTPPSKRDAQAVQSKIGGTIGSVSA